MTSWKPRIKRKRPILFFHSERMTPDCEERPPRWPSSDIDGLSPVLRLERMDSTGLAQGKKEHPPKKAQKKKRKKKGHNPIGPKRKRIGLSLETVGSRKPPRWWRSWTNSNKATLLYFLKWPKKDSRLEPRVCHRTWTYWHWSVTYGLPKPPLKSYYEKGNIELCNIEPCNHDFF